MVKPYTILEETKTHQIRLFENFNPTDLYWHRDMEDRIVELLEGSIYIQLDNSMPTLLQVSDRILIRKNTYHRVIANNNFKVKITFLD